MPPSSPRSAQRHLGSKVQERDRTYTKSPLYEAERFLSSKQCAVFMPAYDWPYEPAHTESYEEAHTMVYEEAHTISYEETHTWSYEEAHTTRPPPPTSHVYIRPLAYVLSRAYIFLPRWRCADLGLMNGIPSGCWGSPKGIDSPAQGNALGDGATRSRATKNLLVMYS